MKRDNFCRVGALCCSLLFAAYYIWNPFRDLTDPTLRLLLRSAVPRAIGSLVFLFVLLYRQFPVWCRPQFSHLTAILPALVIAVNNFPLIALATGNARITRGELLWLLILDALCIGLFEELAFRGVFFPLLLQKFGRDKRGVIWVTVISSAVFGLVHLVNLIEGAGFGGTVLQVGYSFLIGGMCAIVLLKTGNLFWCILLHTVYDLGGALISTLGEGTLWDLPTVVLTVVLSIAVTAWMLYLLFRTSPTEASRLYQNQEGDEAHD